MMATSHSAARGLAMLLTVGATTLLAVGVAHGEQDSGEAAAAKAYGAGNYAEAARRYKVLVETHGPSADLLYNLGTARAEAGQPGRAIFALERARVLAPRDEGIARNLDIVRQRVRIARMEKRASHALTEGEPDDIFWYRVATWFDPVVLAWIVVLFNFLTFGALAVRRSLRAGALRDTFAVGAMLAVTGLVLSLSTLLFHAAVTRNVQIGVVLDETAQLHQTPTATALTRGHPDVYPGAVLRVLDQRSDGWTKVRVVDDTVGWLPSSEIGAID